MAYNLFVPTVIVFTAATCIKILLIPAYHSTDFEVHRNWLAITHSIPLSRWYYEATSEWTLDYPPLFAWFEWLLSWPAAMVDPSIVQINNFNYSASSCVLFQRLSVIISDVVLLFAVLQYCKWKSLQCSGDSEGRRYSLVVALLVLLNIGLLLVDHIHFQYNGFLYGILLLSITRMLQGRHLQAAGLFALLLNLKHIYLYVAPAYFIYLLKHHCFTQPHTNHGKSGACASESKQRFLLTKMIELSAIVGGVFILSFGPFLYYGQIVQVFSRLFPFKRGLCHAYWAPNFWALYNAVDKVLATFGFAGSKSGSMTSGLVGEMEHQVLPSIQPVLTMILTLSAIMPAMLQLWKKSTTNAVDFLHCLILCGYASFLFGWHVHEKAIMMVTIPMCLLVLEDHRHWRIFIVISTAAHISLFPLLYKAAESLIKVCLFVLYLMIALISPALLKR